MAAVWPSIMSLGATMSAPASAWVTAVRASSSRVASFSTSPDGVTMPQWPWSVYSQRQTSQITHEVRVGVFEGAHGLLDDAVAGVGLGCPAGPSTPAARTAAPPGRPRDSQLLRLARELVERELILPRHRRDLVADAAAVGDEQRVDEVARVEPRLGHETSQRLGRRRRRKRWKVVGMRVVVVMVIPTDVRWSGAIATRRAGVSTDPGRVQGLRA